MNWYNMVLSFTLPFSYLTYNVQNCVTNLLLVTISDLTVAGFKYFGFKLLADVTILTLWLEHKFEILKHE